MSARAINDLNTFLVGGAVRDALLGREVGDRDWVVIGGSVEEMLALGFTQVGRDFPVFLHPTNGEEYALARTERKQGSGHTGFTVHADADVTLEEDLKRRDLTINAIAQAPDGELIDPYGGVADLGARQLRHVSEAFSEDPLRVLRVARLAAELPGFVVVDDTRALMRAMCEADALAELSAERVWQELVRALGAPEPDRFFAVLEDCGGVRPWFVELADRDWHFCAGDAFHRFASLPLGEATLEALSARVKVPKHYHEAARDWHRWGDIVANADAASTAALVEALETLRAMHDTHRLEFVLEHASLTSGVDQHWLLAAVRGLAEVKPGEAVAPGPAYGEAQRAARIEWLESARAGLQRQR